MPRTMSAFFAGDECEPVIGMHNLASVMRKSRRVPLKRQPAPASRLHHSKARFGSEEIDPSRRSELGDPLMEFLGALLTWGTEAALAELRIESRWAQQSHRVFCSDLSRERFESASISEVPVGKSSPRPRQGSCHVILHTVNRPRQDQRKRVNGLKVEVPPKRRLG